MKIIIVVPDGVGVRNYLYSSFIDNFNNDTTEVIIYHKLSNSAIKEIKKVKPFLKNFVEIPSFIENPSARLLRESLCYARLLRNKKELNNKTILNFWSPSKKGIKKKLLYFLAEVFGTIISKSTILMLNADKKYEHIILNTENNIINFLSTNKPDFILNLHQRTSITAPIFTKATALNIKTATVIFSWDNVPKARLISRYNFYFVWSALMKKQLCLLYGEINPKNVFVVGSPQFEFHKREEFRLTKETFFKEYNLNSNKKTICFSGDDVMTSPYDQIFLEDLCDALLNFNEEDRPQIIFRRCPVDFSTRFDAVLEKYKHIITVIHPDWRVEKESEKNSFSLIYPSYHDLKLLVNTCLHSDLVINLGSTMAHDFAVHNKPCLYLNYNPKAHKYWSVKKTYKYEHFRSMAGLDAVGWVNSANDFYPLLKKVFEHPNHIAKDRILWLKKIVNYPIENNVSLLANTIISEINKN